MNLGFDHLWWPIPTHPELKTNYYEKTWSKRELREIRRNGDDMRPEEESDSSKKQFSKEQRRSNNEKKVLIVLLVCTIFTWFFYL